MKNKKQFLNLRNNKKSKNYTSFFTEETPNQGSRYGNQKNDKQSSLKESKNFNEKSSLKKVLKKTEIGTEKLSKAFPKNEEKYNMEDSFEIEEEENKIDLPFHEDELYSNILMEFLPKLKQEIVANKVQRRRSDIVSSKSVRR
jgi:hypothetical protein